MLGIGGSVHGSEWPRGPGLERALAERLQPRRCPTEVNEQRVNSQSVTHPSVLGLDDPQGGRRGDAGRVPGPGRRVERGQVLSDLA